MFRHKLLRLIGLAFLQGFLYLALIIVFSLGMVGFSFMLAGPGFLAVPAGILLFTLYLGFYAGTFFLKTCLHFSFTALAIEDIGARKAVSTSFRLVKGNFWRTLGITLLVDMILSTVISLASSPFILASMVPFFITAFQLSNSAGGSEGEVLRMMMSSFSGPGFSIFLGLAILVEGVLTGMVAPLFNTIFYVDLKVRKGELADTADYQGLDAAAGRPSDAAGL